MLEIIAKNRKARKYSSVVLIITLILSMNTMLFSREVNANEKAINVEVTVEGLPAGQESTVILQREDDGVVEKIEKITIENIAYFTVSPGGEIVIYGEEVLHYDTISSATMQLGNFQGNFNKYATLEYTPKTDEEADVILNQENLNLFIGEEVDLEALLVPVNASYVVNWESNTKSVKVDANGKVTGVSEGIGIVTVTATDNLDNSYEDTCNVSVYEFEEAKFNLDDIDAYVDEAVELPNSIEFTYDDNVTFLRTVKWSPTFLDKEKQIFMTDDLGEHEITGTLIDTSIDPEYTVTQRIVVIPGEPDSKGEIGLDYNFISMYLTDDDGILKSEGELKITSSTFGDDEVYEWSSSDESIVSIVTSEDTKSVTITAVTTGECILKVTDSNGLVTASTQISITINPAFVDAVRIEGTNDEGVQLDQFELKEDVFISVYGTELVSGSNVTFYIKVEENGHAAPLGDGEIVLTEDMIYTETAALMFNLYDETDFTLTGKNSSSYVVSLSADSSYPTGDEDGIPKTLVDNFKITSPIPTGDITVSFKQNVNGLLKYPDRELWGTDVILGREIKEITAAETTYSHYLSPYWDENDSTTPKYSDEAKMIGHINSVGNVDWDTPKEVLKIGGYILVTELDLGYISNLNQYNPYSSDGELYKEIHITRNDVVNRDLTFTYTKILDKNNMTMYVGESLELSVITENPVYHTRNLNWTTSAGIDIVYNTDESEEKILNNVNILGVTPGESEVYLKDENGATLATCKVNVLLEDAIVAANDLYSITENSLRVEVDILQNDTTSDDTLIITEIISVDGSDLTELGLVLENNSITYEPQTDYSGTITFDYKIKNKKGDEDTASVTIIVNKKKGSNTLPEANNDNYSIEENSAESELLVLENDTDSDNDTLLVTSITPLKGLKLVAGKILYTPEADFNGTQELEYTITDGYDVAKATVTIDVAKANYLPEANSDTHKVDENSGKNIFDVLKNDIDLDGDLLEITSITALAGLDLVDGIISYTPPTGFFGTESFEYTITDGNGGFDTEIVNIVVNEIVATTTTSTSSKSSRSSRSSSSSSSSGTSTITGISLNENLVELEYGPSALLENTNYDLKEKITGSSSSLVNWSSSDETVATVDQNGVVTALSEGQTIITVTHVNSKKTATSQVTVHLVKDEETVEDVKTLLESVENYEPYILGYTDGSFRPEQIVTRAEVATMFGKILCLDNSYTDSPKFNDVLSDDWYYNCAQAMHRMKIFNGDENGNFRANDPITRAEIATVFANYCKSLNIDVDDSNSILLSDVNKSHWANSYINMMSNSNVISCYEDGTFRPNNEVLREEIVVMINKLTERPPYIAEDSTFNDVLNKHSAYGDIEAASHMHGGSQMNGNK